MTVALTSLGCAKNLVNSEQMLYLLKNAGFEPIGDTAEADINLLNTCAFIESAREEAVENIEELAKMPGFLIVAGCYAQRYGESVFELSPKVSAIVGCGSFDEIAEVAERVKNGETRVVAMAKTGRKVSETPRIVSGCDGSAYLKIADGCSNNCAYCAIPSIRGPFSARPEERIVEEAKGLASAGIRELNIIAQDITRYENLPRLLKRLCTIEELKQIRLNYLYPDEITDELIDIIAAEDKILKYLDIPVQHSESDILRLMNRRGDNAYLRSLFTKIRDKVPGIVLRTSIITGFPGETEEHHRALCDFLHNIRFERAGVFIYSPEEGTAAASLPLQVPDDVKARRADELIELQSEIMTGYNESLVGQTIEVLCEGYDRLTKIFYGRGYMHAPDVDGKVFFTSKKLVYPGEFVQVKITDTMECDLLGKRQNTTDKNKKA